MADLNYVWYLHPFVFIYYFISQSVHVSAMFMSPHCLLLLSIIKKYFKVVIFIRLVIVLFGNGSVTAGDYFHFSLLFSPQQRSTWL